MEINQDSPNVKFSGLAGENLVLLSRAGDYFPVKRSSSALQRYWRRENHENKLETVLLFGRRYTSTEAIQRFVERSLKMSGNCDTLSVPINPSKKRDVESGRKKFGLPPSGKDGEVAE